MLQIWTLALTVLIFDTFWKIRLLSFVCQILAHLHCASTIHGYKEWNCWFLLSVAGYQCTWCLERLISKMTYNVLSWTLTRPVRKGGSGGYEDPPIAKNIPKRSTNYGQQVRLLLKLHLIWSVDSEENHGKGCHQRSHFMAKMHQIRFRLGLRRRPHWGELTGLPQTL